MQCFCASWVYKALTAPRPIASVKVKTLFGCVLLAGVLPVSSWGVSHASRDAWCSDGGGCHADQASAALALLPLVFCSSPRSLLFSHASHYLSLALTVVFSYHSTGSGKRERFRCSLPVCSSCLLAMRRLEVAHAADRLIYLSWLPVDKQAGTRTRPTRKRRTFCSPGALLIPAICLLLVSPMRRC